MKKIFALLLAMTFIFGAMSITAHAEETATESSNIEFIFDDNTSSEIRERIVADFINPDDNSTSAYGLTCTLLGHNLDSDYVTTITHNARSSAPRCLEETYSYEICTRCDYSEYTLIDATYIYCC